MHKILLDRFEIYDFFVKREWEVWFLIREWDEICNFLPYSTKRWVPGAQWTKEIKTVVGKEQFSNEADNYLKYEVLKETLMKVLKEIFFLWKLFLLVKT